MDFLKTKTDLIDTLVNEYLKHQKTPYALVSCFANHFFQRVSLDYLQRLKRKDLIFYLDFALSSLSQKKGDDFLLKTDVVKLETYQTPRYILSVLSNDRPFIVDTLMEFLKRHHLKPEVIVHPVLSVKRDDSGALQEVGVYSKTSQDAGFIAESYIFVQLKTPKDFNQNLFENELQALYHKLKWAVDDWEPLTAALTTIQTKLSSIPTSLYPKKDVTECQKFVTWLNNRHFVFLGARYIEVETASQDVFCVKEGDITKNLGLLKDEEINAAEDLVPAFCRARVRDNIQDVQGKFPLITVTKTNQRSQIHRSSRIDSIEILDFNDTGRIVGIHQFIGIFTKDSFYVPAFEVPILKQKAMHVFEQFGLDPKWYDGKALIAILDSIPRDEMFYMSEDDLTQISQRVLDMRDTGNLVLFMRPDLYGRYITVIAFIPKERYSFTLKDDIGAVLTKKLGGLITSSFGHVGDLPFARIVNIVTFDRPQSFDLDAQALEAELNLVTLGWTEHLERHIYKTCAQEELAGHLTLKYKTAFDASYQKNFDPQDAFGDILLLEKAFTHKGIEILLYPSAQQKTQMKLKLFHANDPLSLSALLPILYNLGIRVTSEITYTVNTADHKAYVHDFDLEWDEAESWDQNIDLVYETFKAVWNKQAENDALNQLTVKAGLNARQISLIRAYSRYLQQIKIPFSSAYVEATLVSYPEIVKLLIELFEERFDVRKNTQRDFERIANIIRAELQGVTRLDHDRIFQRFLNIILSTLRTNYYQLDAQKQMKDAIALKIDCARVDDLPQPRPLYEIYVYSPRVEAVHLRSGKVARGGIRWSDRFEDFRTEVLGLMKAQKVKNSVIVPLGSKGGFIVKNQEHFPERAALMKEVIACYEIMMHGLLDLTDNRQDGQTIPPRDVICYDEPDPYLVVAADKGTATFSDIANGISQQHGFWLDDAFASGGSVGYDHKKMAITSRGAWESVKRHFREIGHDVQKKPFSVIGVGDMAGDVFGNGMLRSTQIRLLAAFNHQHIFIDPNPDVSASYGERSRLFALPRSTWQDYSPELISPGGGVFERTAKTIPLTPQMRESFGLTGDCITPDHLIQHLLCFPVDLLWFGGIGTFIKATTESHADVGDVANNAIRVDAVKVQAHCIGEGANLGVTQLGRIEYALKGGRINTDAIDNSAGVDCSDHEVNIKILFNVMTDRVSRAERDVILKEMTDEVAALVLQDNYRQTQILSIMESHGPSALLSYQFIMKQLENDIHLNRALEFLPDDEIIERRLSRNQGMTRPELAVLLAYAKISLYNKIMDSNLADDLFFHPYLTSYFPRILAEKYEWAINRHPLKREIIATALSNTLINRVGIHFLYELASASGRREIDVVKAFFHAIDLLGLNEFWDQIDAIDDKMLCQLEIDTYKMITGVLREVVLWLLRTDHRPALHKTYIQQIQRHLSSLVEGEQQLVLARKVLGYLEKQLDQTLCEKIAVLPHYPSAVAIANHIEDPNQLTNIASAYFILRSRFGLDWLCEQVQGLSAENDWQRSSKLCLLDELNRLQSRLITLLMEDGYSYAVQNWLILKEEKINAAQRLLDMVRAHTRVDFGLLSFAANQMGRIID